MTSPLTHSVSGTAKAAAQTVIATNLIESDGKSLMWWVSNVMVLLGSLGYTRAKQLEMSEKSRAEGGGGGGGK